jgi:hypothetical protein
MPMDKNVNLVHLVKLTVTLPEDVNVSHVMPPDKLM